MWKLHAYDANIVFDTEWEVLIENARDKTFSRKCNNLNFKAIFWPQAETNGLGSLGRPIYEIIYLFFWADETNGMGKRVAFAKLLFINDRHHRLSRPKTNWI